MFLSFLSLVLVPQATQESWINMGRAAPKNTVSFYLPLHVPAESVATLERLLYAVSDPKSSQYGQYISRDEALAITSVEGRAEEVVHRLGAPLNKHCVAKGDVVRCSDVSVVDIESKFRTRLHRYQHARSGRTIVAVRPGAGLEVPEAVVQDVAFVAGLSLGPDTRTRPHQNSTDENVPGDELVVTPYTLRQMYNITTAPTAALAAPNHIMAALEFQDAGVVQTDTDHFNTWTGSDVHISRSIGPTNLELSLEASLDVQYLGAVAQGNTLWLHNVARGWMYSFTQEYLNITEPRPSVVSISYAWDEEKQCSKATGAECKKRQSKMYIDRTNTEFMKLGAMGATLVVASGDSGAHGRTDEKCNFNPKTHPTFPASSPYVLTAGGTQIDPASGSAAHPNSEPICNGGGCSDGGVCCAGGGVEIVASTETKALIVSGGGFSEVAPRPSYQDSAVKTYLDGDYTPPKNTFNENGRGYPDVSALAHKYLVAYSSAIELTDGTSAAAPVVAGMLSLINSRRQAKGQAALGFVNPLLYAAWAKNKNSFHDIVKGSNRCSEAGCRCKKGFFAAPGWDAVTGLGTPNFGVLSDTMDEIISS